ncbi:hypothetical protein BDP27DRAFT_1176672, partial [Rhodocollybia butyracea]
MGWSFQTTTCAAQKLPQNINEIALEAYLQEAYLILNYSIAPEFCRNTDQTQTVFQQGTGNTWHQKGDKQVPAAGIDEKRVFILAPSIS